MFKMKKLSLLMMQLDYPLWLRAAHFFNFLLLSLLVRSGFDNLERTSEDPTGTIIARRVANGSSSQRSSNLKTDSGRQVTRRPLSRRRLPYQATKTLVSDGTGTFSLILRGF